MNTQSQKLATDIRILVRDAEELVKATAMETGDKVVELRRRMQQVVNQVKPQIAKIETVLTETSKSAAACTDTYVHDNPWAAIGISAGVGMVIGLLISRH